MVLRMAWLFCVVGSAIAFGDDPSEAIPRTPDPVLRLVRIDQFGSLVVNLSESFPILETRVANVAPNRNRFEYKQTQAGLELIEVPDADEIQIEYTLKRESVANRSWTVGSSRFRVFDLKGNIVEGAELGLRLKTAKPAFISTYENSVVDPLYLSTLKQDGLIIVINEPVPKDETTQSPSDVPAPQAKASPLSLRRASFTSAGSNGKEASSMDELFESLLRVIEHEKEPVDLRIEAIETSIWIAEKNANYCSQLAKTLAKIISDPLGNPEVRRFAIKSVQHLDSCLTREPK